MGKQTKGKRHGNTEAKVTVTNARGSFRNVKTLAAELARLVPRTDVGYAGFSSRANLAKYLEGSLYDDGEAPSVPGTLPAVPAREAAAIVKRTLAACDRILPGKGTNAFIFPTLSSFVLKEMGGTTGFTPWANTVIASINPASKAWRRALPATVAHEYCHGVTMQHHRWRTLLDSLAFEGLAECLRLDVAGDVGPKLTGALTERRSLALVRSLAPKLSSTDKSLYRSVFFGGSGFPRWAGYAAGYHLVSRYRRRHPKTTWPELIKVPFKIYIGDLTR